MSYTVINTTDLIEIKNTLKELESIVRSVAKDNLAVAMCGVLDSTRSAIKIIDLSTNQ